MGLVHRRYKYFYNILFIVLSLVAALLLPINSIIEVKSLPTHQDSALADLHYLLVVPFVRVKVVNLLFEIGGNSWISVFCGGSLWWLSAGGFDSTFGCVYKCIEFTF